MTTKTFSDEDSIEVPSADESIPNRPLTSRHVEHISQRSFTSPSQRRLDIEEHLSFLRHFHTIVKSNATAMYYPCFLEKLDYKNFTRYFNRHFSHVSRKKKNFCICPLSSIPAHSVNNCKNYNRWAQAHKDIILRCFEYLESSFYHLDDFAHFAYKYSSPCSCSQWT